MKWPKELLLVLLAVAVLISCGFVGGCRWANKKSQAATTQAELKAKEHQGRADALVEQAKAKDEVVVSLGNEVRDAKAVAAAKVARAAQLERALLAAHAAVPVGPNQPVDPPPYPDLAPIVLSLKEVIVAKDEVIRQQDLEKVALVISRDMWKAAEGERFKQVRCLEIALEAQKALVNSAYWRGYWTGLATGVGGDEAWRRLR